MPVPGIGIDWKGIFVGNPFNLQDWYLPSGAFSPTYCARAIFISCRVNNSRASKGKESLEIIN